MATNGNLWNTSPYSIYARIHATGMHLSVTLLACRGTIPSLWRSLRDKWAWTCWSAGTRTSLRVASAWRIATTCSGLLPRVCTPLHIHACFEIFLWLFCMLHHHAKTRLAATDTAFEFEGRFFVNPGSATGAYHGGQETGDGATLTTYATVPSFALMDVQGSAVTTYVYRLLAGEVKVEKLDFIRPTSAPTSAR